MKIGFDKRLELIYGILYCVNKDLNNELHKGLFIDEMPTYCNEFYEIYKKGITDEFKNYITNYGMSGSWATPAVIALSLDENYKIVESDDLHNTIEKYIRSYNKEKLESYLIEFVKKSNYEEFYTNHSLFYSNILEEYKKSMSSYNVFDENVIEDFYGYKLGNMNINLYNFTTGSMGILIGNNQYYNQRVDNITKDENNFKFKSKINNIFHEFSHPYIAPLVENYCSNIDFTNLYENVKENGLRTDVYQSMKPYEILNEYLVRSIALYLESKYNDPESIEKRISIEKSNGFIYVEEIASLFDKKNEYKSFDEFFKEQIIPFCIELNDNLKNNKNL